MFNMLSGALQSAADVVAPPPTPLQDFEYHWKTIKGFYAKDVNEQRVHIGSTNIPHHLQLMLDLLVAESQQSDESAECIQFVISTRPLDLLVDLAINDSPPGMKGEVLKWTRKLLSNLNQLPIDEPSLFEPLLKLMTSINRRDGSAGAYEREEVFFMIAIAGAVVRKPEIYLDLFVDTHHRRPPHDNPLFDCDVPEPTVSVGLIKTAVDQEASTNPLGNEAFLAQHSNCVNNSHFLLLLTMANYLSSPSHEIVIKACEGALIIFASVTDQWPNPCCPSIVNAMESFVDTVICKLCKAYLSIPEDIDSLDVEMESVSWGLNMFDSNERHFIGRLPLLQFLRWLDYYDALTRECRHEQVLKYLSFKFRADLLQDTLQPAVCDGTYPSEVMLLAKIIKQLHCSVLFETCVQWLIDGDRQVLATLLDNAQENRNVVLETLHLIEVFIDRPNGPVLEHILLRHLSKRAYYAPEGPMSDRNAEVISGPPAGTRSNGKSKTLAPDNILTIINHFLLLLPRQITGEYAGTAGYEEYVQDASRHYRQWIEKTEDLAWPREAISVPVASHVATSDSQDSGFAEDTFNEGPLLRMLFQYIRTMSQQPYELNLAVIAIISKLALLPHPYLHEVLLNPTLAIIPGASTLWTALQDVTKYILAEVPLLADFQVRIEATSKRLLVPDQCGEESMEDNPLLESVIVLQEFSKELAAIAFVKYHYGTEETG